jgi:hypothetical protein
MCVSLCSAGYSVVLVAPDSVSCSLQNFSIKSTGRPKNRLLRMGYHSFKTALKAISVNADIYHFHDSEFLPYALIFRALGKRVIYDSHEDLPEDVLSKEYLSTPIRKPLSIIIRTFLVLAAKQMSHVIGATDSINDKFKSVCCFATTLNNYPIIGELDAPEIGVPKENQICYIGMISPEIELIVKKLNIDLYTHVVDWDVMRDLQLAYFKASVINCYILQDHAFLGVIYGQSTKYGIHSACFLDIRCQRCPKPARYTSPVRNRPVAELPGIHLVA